MEMRHIQDQMGRTVEIPLHPRRIVSIVPSQTELLAYLGAPLVGRTRFCIHPEDIKPIPRVGGTKKLDFDRIAALKPDLIIGNKEENEQSDIEELEKLYPVWMSDIVTVDDALDMITGIGALIHETEKASTLRNSITASIKRIQAKAIRFYGLKVLYFIWKNPWMLAGQGTFIHEILQLAGFENVAIANRYPELTEPFPNADLLFLSSEPYPFKNEHVREAEALIQGSNAFIVDGEVFSWYGNRLLLLESYLDQLETNLLQKKA